MKPGRTRAVSTVPTAVAPPILAAKTAIAMTPIQSPRLETSCARKNLKKFPFFRSER